jgi:hypothetical protein
MKLIDLINDLFDYREFQTDKLPKKIRCNNKEFVFVDNSYYNENGINIMAYVENTLDLRVEIEIIEEDKEIEEIELYNNLQDCYNNEDKLDCNFEEIENKINELVKAVNSIKKGN